jgi:CheY-like chemotaxis protein
MGSKLSSSRILVIDDDLLVLDVLEAMLTSAGHGVKVVNDPHIALELIWKEDFDAVITDLGMPMVNGWAVARQVKAKNAMTPVIVVTGWGGQHEKRDPLSCGVDFLFSKPVDLQVLIGAVEELMAHSTRRPGRNRRHKRFPGKRGESVRVAPLSPDSPTCLGELLDVSRSGICFRHSAGENPVGALLRVEIRSPEGFDLDLSPALVVYDMTLEHESGLRETTTSRCCGIQFEDLSQERAFQLESFIRSRASNDN